MVQELGDTGNVAQFAHFGRIGGVCARIVSSLNATPDGVPPYSFSGSAGASRTPSAADSSTSTLPAQVILLGSFSNPVTVMVLRVSGGELSRH